MRDRGAHRLFFYPCALYEALGGEWEPCARSRVKVPGKEQANFSLMGATEYLGYIPLDSPLEGRSRQCV